MDLFSHYRQYLVNYNISIVVLQTTKQSNERFKQLVNVRTSPGTHGARTHHHGGRVEVPTDSNENFSLEFGEFLDYARATDPSLFALDGGYQEIYKPRSL